MQGSRVPLRKLVSFDTLIMEIRETKAESLSLFWHMTKPKTEEYVLSLKEIKEQISIVRYSKRGIYPCCLLLIADRVFQNPARLPT